MQKVCLISKRPYQHCDDRHACGTFQSLAFLAKLLLLVEPETTSSLLLRQLFLQTHVYFIYKVSVRLNYLDRNKKSEEVKSRSLLYLEVSMIVLKTCEEWSS